MVSIFMTARKYYAKDTYVSASHNPFLLSVGGADFCVSSSIVWLEKEKFVSLSAKVHNTFLKSMKKFLNSIALLVLLLFPLVVHAVIAYPGKRIVKLADGSRVELTLVGDEHMHYYLTSEGRSVRLFDDGTLQEIGRTELQLMQQMANQHRQVANQRRLSRRKVGNITPLTGKKRGIVILVNFRDNAFSMPDAKAFYSDFFNKVGNFDGQMTGSVRDYFLEQSYGKFEIEFDVVGPITLSKNMEYYGASDGAAKDSHPGEMIIEACKAANSAVNFRDYDWNGNGYVDQVFVVYAGYGENYGASSQTIWPHESNITEQLMLDGTKISTYACSCELRGMESDAEIVVDGIGTACHEFSHCLGFPDFYNTASGGRSSLSTWDLLDSGSYNNFCRTPAGYTSYERWQAGWLTPTEITRESVITDMKPLAQSPEAYILYNDANHNEYFLIENRQPVGFDRGLYGHGMLILHADYQADAWANNMVNISKTHERLSLITADGNDAYTAVGMEGDPFPGRSGNTMFTDLSTPASTLFNENRDGTLLLHKGIECISESSNGLISFSAMLPVLHTPDPGIAATGLNTFTIEWPVVSRATGYELQLFETPAKKSPAESLILKENFEKTYSAKAGLKDISSSLDEYLSTRRFTGTNLYTNPNLLRIGTGSTPGTLLTPVLRSTETGEATIVLTFVPFEEGTPVGGRIQVLTNGKPYERIDLNFSTTTTLVLHPTTVIDDIFRVELYPDSRCYIQYLAIYDGNFSEEELGLTTTRSKVRRRVNVSNYVTSTNSYTFRDLNPTSLYSVQVRSLENGRVSIWSEPIEVTLSDDDAIHGVQQSLPTTDVWYDLQARPTFTPKSGIYIQNGRKVFF